MSDSTDFPHSDYDAEEMGKYAITRVSVDYFHVGGYRYTSLADAIAEGKRSLQRK